MSNKITFVQANALRELVELGECYANKNNITMLSLEKHGLVQFIPNIGCWLSTEAGDRMAKMGGQDVSKLKHNTTD